MPGDEAVAATAANAEKPIYGDTKYPGTDLTLADIHAIAFNAAAGGQYPNVAKTSQAFIRICRGIDMGLKPTEGLSALQIIATGGKPSLEAAAMASLVQRSNRFRYLVVEHTEQVCELTFQEADEHVDGGWRELGKSRFTIQDAEKAELTTRNQNWKKYPRNQLFARAISNGCRWYCPAIFGGPVYTPDEEDEIVAADGAQQQSSPRGSRKASPMDGGGGQTGLPAAVEEARKKAGLGKGRAEMLYAERSAAGASDEAIANEIAHAAGGEKPAPATPAGGTTAPAATEPAKAEPEKKAPEPGKKTDEWGF